MEASVKTALVCGAGGFIGHNLVKRLKKEGWYVVGLDLKLPAYEESPANVFIQEDARTHVLGMKYDRIYQLAAEMGGAGYIFSGEHDADVLANSLAINLNIAKQATGSLVFFSSSACAYPDGVEGKEEDAYPANPPFDYGWEKLISERIYQAYARNYGLNIRIARFQNCFGPYGTYKGGREKAPAAISRKIIESTGEIEIWGNGEQIRPFVYIEDLLDGIEVLMQSDYNRPVNLGPSEGITINHLIAQLIGISGKPVTVKYIDGPTGELHRRCNNDLAKGLGWEPKWPLGKALNETYQWIKKTHERETL
jgi:nucleoside-diphosphate-sugar epimerase